MFCGHTEKPHFNPEKAHVIAISPQSVETQKQFVEHENFNVSSKAASSPSIC